MNTKQQTVHDVEIIFKRWHVITFAIGILFTAGVFYADTKGDISELTGKYNNIEPRIDKIDERLNTLEILAAKSGAQMEGMRSDVTDMKSDMQDIKKYMYSLKCTPSGIRFGVNN